jgi:hypothetical protein
MKNLFIITEEERKRILSLHENATKRQYLGEAKVTGDQFSGRNIQFDKETKYTQDIFNLVFQKTNVDETRLTDVIISIPDLNTFIKVNNELKNTFKLMGSKYSGLDSIIADVIDFGNDDTDVERLRTYFNRIGVTTNQLGNDYYSFGELNPKSEELPNPQETKVETNWKNYPCVTSHPKAKQVKLADGSFKYIIGNFDYYSNGRKKNITTKQMSSYNCETEFKQQSVVKESPCPVGDASAVKLFQDWLDSRVKGWISKYPDGLKKDPKKGYGMCGPNTRKAWTQYGKQYKTNPEQNVAVSSKSFTPQPGEDDVVIPDNTVNQGVANPSQTPIRGTGRGSGLGNMEINQP